MLNGLFKPVWLPVARSSQGMRTCTRLLSQRRLALARRLQRLHGVPQLPPRGRQRHRRLPLTPPRVSCRLQLRGCRARRGGRVGLRCRCARGCRSLAPVQQMRDRGEWGKGGAGHEDGGSAVREVWAYSTTTPLGPLHCLCATAFRSAHAKCVPCSCSALASDYAPRFECYCHTTRRADTIDIHS